MAEPAPETHSAPNNLAEDRTPYLRSTYAALLAFCVIGMMFGPAIATFMALGWPKRPGAKGLLVCGILFMALHFLLLVAALSLPAFLPWLHSVTGLGKTSY